MTALLLTLAGPAAAATWYEEPFERGAPSALWGWDRDSSGHVGDGIRTVMEEGQHFGGSGNIELSSLGQRNVDELYWRYWLRLDPNFRIAPPSRGKLPGPAGLYSSNCRGGRVSTVAEPCWSARTLFSRDYDGPGNGPADVTVLGSYIYHLDARNGDNELLERGDIELWEESDAARLEHGRWYCVEGRVRMNSPGANNGVMQAWVDGQLAYDRAGLRLRRSSESQIHVKSFWMDVYYGGKDKSPRDNFVEVDSLALGSERQGCDDSYAGSFLDDDTSIHAQDIEWLANQGVTKGCNPPTNNRFCPRDRVSRGEMAAFLTRALDLPAGSRDFRDSRGSVFRADIAALARAGITKGCNPPANDRFCPDQSVTREQMAAFLNRAYSHIRSRRAPFRDTAGSMFEGDIGGLAAAGVTKGCNPPANTNYCPDDPVTREQMASFLRRADTG